MVERHTITVTTDGGGALTGFSPLSARGEIRQVCYTPDTSTPLHTNTNINLTGAYLNCSEQCFDARFPDHAAFQRRDGRRPPGGVPSGRERKSPAWGAGLRG
jgi:hypothetical protein